MIGTLLVAALVGSAGYVLVKWLVRVASEPTDDTRPLDRVTRRQLLLGGVGSATIVGVGVLDEPWGHRCEESPADCRIRTDDRVPIEISVQVAQDGKARFSTTEELGGRDPTASYAEVLPIGCSRPQVLDVTVETDVGGTTSERVTFEAPASTAGALAGATLAITATRAEIEMIAEYDYTPVQ